MVILDSENVFDYLAGLNYCELNDRHQSEIELIPAKNFNLLITLPNGRQLLVKQELPDAKGETYGEFWAAWEMKIMVDRFTDWGSKIAPYLPQLLYFDEDNSILLVDFLSDYQDLHDYYHNEHQFPLEIAQSIGTLLGTIHHDTFQRDDVHQFISDRPPSIPIYNAISRINRIGKISPRIFKVVPRECLQFFKLYQRFPSLNNALQELSGSLKQCCLVHNDLKLNNFLLDNRWQDSSSKIIRLIDWERVGWGDPAYDLGSIIGSYLELWLDGLLISNSLSINDSLKLANIPLELIQPSLFHLVKNYLVNFPAILVTRPDYLLRVVQCAGVYLIRRIEINIQDDRVFNNHGIILLQVSKQLLCAPESSIKTIFGVPLSQLLPN